MSAGAKQFWSFGVRRWVGLLAVTVVVQLQAAFWSEQFICACWRPQIVPFLIRLVPFAWGVILVLIYKGWTERVVAWGTFGVALAMVCFGSGMRCVSLAEAMSQVY